MLMSLCCGRQGSTVLSDTLASKTMVSKKTCTLITLRATSPQPHFNLTLRPKLDTGACPSCRAFFLMFRIGSLTHGFDPGILLFSGNSVLYDSECRDYGLPDR